MYVKNVNFFFISRIQQNMYVPHSQLYKIQCHVLSWMTYGYGKISQIKIEL